ncbi:MAG: hypothetical protein IJ402_05565 [Bacteroidales bacterium]|nr:hypothetical protein [Bacteroidales bacterium]
MKRLILSISLASFILAMVGCQENCCVRNDSMNPEKQEREFLRNAVRHHSQDVQRVDIIDSTVVYTHIFDGIVDIKTYTFDGDLCVSAERIYTFPDQMSALRHYRRAVEKADLYDNIEMFNNQVKYKLKEAQYKMETEGLSKEQLKAKFDKRIDDAKADLKRHEEKMKVDLKRDGKDIENDMKGGSKDYRRRHDKK